MIIQLFKHALAVIVVALELALTLVFALVARISTGFYKDDWIVDPTPSAKWSILVWRLSGWLVVSLLLAAVLYVFNSKTLGRGRRFAAVPAAVCGLAVSGSALVSMLNWIPRGS